MIKRIKAELAARKGVRLGASGGSLVNDYKCVGHIPVSLGMYTPRLPNGANAMVQFFNHMKSKSLFSLYHSSITIHQKAIIGVNIIAWFERGTSSLN